MKKILILYFAVMLSVILVGCGCNHEYDGGKVTKEATCQEEGIKTYTCKLCNKEKTETIPLAEHTYDSGKVTKEATFTEEGLKTFTCKNCGDSYTEAIPVREDKVVLTVTNKINYEADVDAWRFSPFVELVYKIENMTDKEIKGVEGELVVKDLFGKKIITIGWDITGENIPANGSITQEGYGVEINQFMDVHMKLYNTNYDDLKFEYNVKKIVYADGTTESL